MHFTQIKAGLFGKFIKPRLKSGHLPNDKDGRPRVNDRACLTGILFILKTGTPWQYLPREMRCGSGMTCWRLAEDMAGLAGRVGYGRCNRLVCFCHGQLFSSRTFWGTKTGPNPTDRGKNGSKRHLIVDGQGAPLAIEHTGANVHDSEMAIALVDGISAIKQPRGRPRRRPDEVLADRAYDAEEKIGQPLRVLPLKQRWNRGEERKE